MKTILRSIVNNKYLLFKLSLNEIKNRYFDTLGGVFWIFVHPLVFISLYWFVFSFGFKAMGPNDLNFIVYFLPAFISWLFFQETLLINVNCVQNYNHLIKKIFFPIEIIPMISIFSSFIIHIFIFIISIVVIKINNSLVLSETFFYIFFIQLYLFLFCVGLSYFISALNIFIKDFGQFVTILLNIWFWVTPIVWPLTIFSNKENFILSIIESNPIFYIVEGYRFSLLEDYNLNFTIHDHFIFWLVNLFIFFIGLKVYSKLQNDFAEVI